MRIYQLVLAFIRIGIIEAIVNRIRADAPVFIHGEEAALQTFEVFVLADQSLNYLLAGIHRGYALAH